MMETDVTTLNHFLKTWDDDYRDSLQNIPLFNPMLVKDWSQDKKKHFCKVFYHLRGYFHDFLWHMGNHASDKKIKNLIVENIAEEFGRNGLSHEQLYFNFANGLNVDLNEEISSKKNYLPFAQEFNKNHLDWLRTHDADENIAAFSAYERLDNIDYKNLLTITETFGLHKRALTFFSVHVYVEHFNPLQDTINEIWLKSPEKINAGFNFIKKCQKTMWENLSNEVFNCPNA